MPATPAPYQRMLLHGIPYWRDAAGAIYYYESSTPPTEATRICLGSATTGLAPNWQQQLEPVLAAYRAAAKSRARAVAKA